MKIDSVNVLGELERLAAAMPWDSCDIWITREPAGKVTFTAYVRGNDKLGTESVFGGGASPHDAVDDALKKAGVRDPERARKEKIAQLQDTIRKLQAIEIGLPPYRPNRELSAGTLTVPDPVVEV